MLTSIFFRTQPTTELQSEDVEVWEPAVPDSPYYDQGDYDDMEEQASGTSNDKPKNTKKETKEEDVNYEMGYEEGDYIEQES